MSRSETMLMDNWGFLLSPEPTGDFDTVRLPHDWAIDAPINARMEQGTAQGFRDRWGIGWYRRELVAEKIQAGHSYYLDLAGCLKTAPSGSMAPRSADAGMATRLFKWM